jgi:hypothetical protein
LPLFDGHDALGALQTIPHSCVSIGGNVQHSIHPTIVSCLTLVIFTRLAAMAATETLAAVRSDMARSRSSGAYSSADSSVSSTPSSNEAQWGSNFWVTLVDPEVRAALVMAFPATHYPDTPHFQRLLRRQM